jgi:SAM-dependent methyltransferase
MEHLVDWERAEVSRSAHEASGTDLEQLRVDAKEMARYQAPAAETCFPLEYAYHLVGDVRGKTILDFGCGTGENTLLLAGRGARVISMDLSASLIELAKKRLQINGVDGDISFMAGSAHHVPLPDESVDLVFGIAILHHLDLSLAANEVCRLLRKGGRAIFQEPIRNSPTVRILRKLVPYRSPDVSAFERPLTDAELDDFGAQFKAGRTRSFLLPHVRVAQKFPLKRQQIRAMYARDAERLNKYPKLRYYASIRVFEVLK